MRRSITLTYQLRVSLVSRRGRVRLAHRMTRVPATSPLMQRNTVLLEAGVRAR